jgi:hypothetical protein
LQGGDGRDAGYEDDDGDPYRKIKRDVLDNLNKVRHE